MKSPPQRDAENLILDCVERTTPDRTHTAPPANGLLCHYRLIFVLSKRGAIESLPQCKIPLQQLPNSWLYCRNQTEPTSPPDLDVPHGRTTFALSLRVRIKPGAHTAAA